MNLQQISERIRDHLTTQKAQAKKGSACAYRGENGTVCAVGCLIDDEHYSPAFEGQTAADDRVMNAVCESLALGRSVDLVLLGNMLNDWQAYHDSGGYDHWCADDAAAISPADKHGSLADDYWPE